MDHSFAIYKLRNLMQRNTDLELVNINVDAELC